MRAVESNGNYRTEIVALARLYRGMAKSFKINLPKKWQVGWQTRFALRRILVGACQRIRHPCDERICFDFSVVGPIILW